MKFQLAILLSIVAVTAAHGGEALPVTHWRTSYEPAVAAATAQNRLLLLWFFDANVVNGNERFASDVLAQPAIAALVEHQFVAARVPLDTPIAWQPEPARLLAHASFAAMRQQPGLAIVDFTEPGGAHYGHVVSVYPFSRGPIDAQKLAVLLSLPRGTLTQRTLIFAVRTHPDQPASADSHFSQLLTHEAARHSAHQARINLQGHHQWEQRFHAINAQLPSGLVAREVCAESWPGQDLLAAAEECVDSWRQSSGHWEAVSQRHALFGYDLQLGTNGVWYATGIFAH